MDFDIAPLDRLNRITMVVTVILTLGMLSVPLWFPYVFSAPYPSWVQWLLWLPGVLVGLILLGTLLFAPGSYQLTDTELIVYRRLFGRKRYPLSGFTSAEPGKEFKRSMKVAGAAGFFGYYGSFKNKAWGMFHAQATDKDNGLILHGSKPLYISPRESQLFKEMFEAKLEALNRT